MKEALVLDVALLSALAGVLCLAMFRGSTDRLGRARRAALRKNRYVLPGRRT